MNVSPQFARHTFHFWAAAFWGDRAAWKGNATYRNTMYCEVPRHAAECHGEPSIISEHFFFLFDYYQNIGLKAYFSDAGDDNDVYGSGWLFVRWAADQYASDEAAFFQALTHEYTLTGIANVEARTGRPFADMHIDFMMALYADDVPGLTPPAGARYTVASWNLRDMFQGMSQDFLRGGQPIPAFPLRMTTASFGPFTADATLAGGGAAYVELSGTPAASQVLDLRGPGAVPLSAATPLRLAILRVQ